MFFLILPTKKEISLFEHEALKTMLYIFFVFSRCLFWTLGFFSHYYYQEYDKFVIESDDFYWLTFFSELLQNYFQKLVMSRVLFYFTYYAGPESSASYNIPS